MGQYFLLANLDKQEYVHPHHIGGLLKLWEWCANRQAGVIPYLLRKSSETGGGDVDDPEKLLYAGRWASDRIVLIGDYDQSKLYDTVVDTYTDISEGLKQEFNEFMELDDLKLDRPDYINPDMVVGGGGAVSSPKIKT